VNGFEDLQRDFADESIMCLCSGLTACSHLSDAGAVNLLLKVLSDHGNSLSTVTELAVKALVKFMDDPDGKKAFLNGGIRSLVSILKLDAGTADVRNLTAIIPIILVSLSSPLNACVRT